MKKIDKIIYSDKTPDKNSLWAKKTDSGEWECLMFNGSTWIASTNQNILDFLSEFKESIETQTEKACASSLAELNARLLALEMIVSSSLRSTIEVTREFNVWGKTNLNLSGDGAPAFAPDFIGQRYTDITGQNVYDAVGTTTAGDWKLS